jgi:hypothetical protein
MRFRILMSLSVLMLCGASVSVVSAQEASPTSHPFPRVESERVRTVAERVWRMLDEVNARRLAGARTVTERLQRVLERIEDIADRRDERGVDVTVAREAIRKARMALDEAHEVIREQADRTYLLDDANDRTIGDRLRAVRDQLAEDLRTVHATVHEALTAVRAAARALRTL